MNFRLLILTFYISLSFGLRLNANICLNIFQKKNQEVGSKEAGVNNHSFLLKWVVDAVLENPKAKLEHVSRFIDSPFITKVIFRPQKLLQNLKDISVSIQSLGQLMELRNKILRKIRKQKKLPDVIYEGRTVTELDTSKIDERHFDPFNENRLDEGTQVELFIESAHQILRSNLSESQKNQNSTGATFGQSFQQRVYRKPSMYRLDMYKPLLTGEKAQVEVQLLGIDFNPKSTLGENPVYFFNAQLKSQDGSKIFSTFLFALSFPNLPVY